MKKNFLLLPLLLTAYLSLNGINNPDNTNFDFEDQTPVFQELLFGNKPAQSTSAKPAPTVTPPVVGAKPQVDTPVTPVLEVVEPIVKPAIADAQKIDLDHERKLEELQSAADQARKNANNADKMSVGYACLTLASAGGIVAGYFLENNQFTSPFLIATCAFGGLSWYFDTQARSYNEEASQLSDQYDTLKTRINSENGK